MESIDKVKLVVLNQLQGTSGLYSLKLQNHIYGCFIIMEDIAQKVVNVSGTTIQGDKFSFDFDKQFSEIGLRYGFALDSKLILETFQSEYKDMWVEQFIHISKNCDINIVDNLEDIIIEVVQKNIQAQDAFFLNALNTGSLPQDWIELALKLINSPIHINSSLDVENNTDLPQKNNTDEDDDKVQINTVISHAITEKPLHKHRRLDTTRRNKGKQRIPTQKKGLVKTRRNHQHSK